MTIPFNKPKIKVGDLVGYYPDQPRKFCIVSSIQEDEVWGNWYSSMKNAIEHGEHKAGNLGWMHERDVVLISNYLKLPFSECENCIGCEKVKQPFQCKFNCPQKLEMIKKLTRIEK